MSAGFNSEPSRERAAEPLEDSAAQHAAAQHSTAQALLEQVLQATLAMGPGDEPLRPEELRTLAAVAKRRQAEPLTIETVTELVQAVLRWRFRALSSSREQWERMTRQIAETIWDDPQAQPRMRQLFQLLCEAQV